MENCESGPSPDLFGSLGDDLITNILSRTPTRQLRECSTVCKRWLSLLRTPRFVQQHEERSSSSSSVPLVHRGFEQEAESQLLFLKDGELRSVHLDGDTEKMSWPLSQLRASYHGLLLFQEHPFNSTHCIFNPLNPREVVTFKSPDRVCGLYYHPPSNQYRLLCFRKLVTADPGSLLLYYVRSALSQELIKEVGTYDFKIDMEEVVDMEDLVRNYSVCRAVLYPGAHNIPAVAAGSYLYWPVYNRSVASDRHIMAFDVMNETLQLMPHPKGHPPSPESEDLSLLLQHWTARLFEMGSRLHLHVARDRGMEVWALEDHRTWRWAKVIALDGMSHDGMNVSGFRRPLWNRLPITVEDGELLYLLPQRGIFRTNSLTKQVELIGDGGDHGRRFFSFCMVNWRRSLVSFKDCL